ncbi:hypothetical protein CsSME_00005582 [Camellia sinensis var. sinensis]
MVDLNQEQTASPTGADMSAKKKELLSTAMKRTSEWIFSQEIPSDVTVHIGAASFSLHKEMFGTGRKKIEPRQEHEKRVVLETIVSLLPREKNSMSVSFLSMLLRAAIYLETTIACRLDLEKRMGRQLGQAVLDDLLIPLFTFTEDTLFDVDTVQRIMMNFFEYEMEGNRLGYVADEDFVSLSPPLSDMERVGKLMENYIAEIASDRNLTVLRFISLAELIPEQSRLTEDGTYRAIDIYLKVHSLIPLSVFQKHIFICAFAIIFYFFTDVYWLPS